MLVLLPFPSGSAVKNLACRRPHFSRFAGQIPLEEGMATHSSILALRLLWTEEPGGLQSMGFHRVGHD